MYPKIKFKISQKKDVQTFFAFNNEANFDNGENLKWAIFRKYPGFKKYKKGNKLEISKKEVSEFVKKVYLENKAVIYKNLNLYSKNWINMERDYFRAVDDIFDGWPWPKGKYIAFTTIWGMYPRFLEDKTFQIPYKHKNQRYVNVVIAHEMLHFMFYDYFYRKYSKYRSQKNNFFVWNISEIFNSLVQDSPRWAKIFKTKLMLYPQHRKIVNKLKKQAYKKDIIRADELIDVILKNYKFFK